jgi:hypothetical protein
MTGIEYLAFGHAVPPPLPAFRISSDAWPLRGARSLVHLRRGRPRAYAARLRAHGRAEAPFFSRAVPLAVSIPDPEELSQFVRAVRSVSEQSHREDVGEASAGEPAGQSLSRDRKLIPGADTVCVECAAEAAIQGAMEVRQQRRLTVAAAPSSGRNRPAS